MNFAVKVRKHIQASDLSESLQNLAVVFDIDSVRKLITEYPNERIYVPRLQSFRAAIKAAIAEELEVKRYLDLRRMSYELGCSIDHLRALVKEVKDEQKQSEQAGQASLD